MTAETTCETCALMTEPRCSLAGLPLSKIDQTPPCPHHEPRPSPPPDLAVIRAMADAEPVEGRDYQEMEGEKPTPEVSVTERQPPTKDSATECDGSRALHVWTDDCDTVIAASLDDAMAVLDEYGMYDPDPECWERIDDAAEITIHCDADGVPAQPGDGGVDPITKTAAAWAKRGRGFLCTTEY